MFTITSRYFIINVSILLVFILCIPGGFIEREREREKERDLTIGWQQIIFKVLPNSKIP